MSTWEVVKLSHLFFETWGLNKNMTKKQKIVWRLGKLPTTEELRELVKDKILTNEEAREILFSTETEDERDEKSWKAEIKFLRELVDKLSNQDRTRIVEVIREVERPYVRWSWYNPYSNWCSASSGTLYLTTTGTALNSGVTLCGATVDNQNYSVTSTLGSQLSPTEDSSFTTITTF